MAEHVSRFVSALVIMARALMALVLDFLAALLLALALSADELRRFVVELARLAIVGMLVAVVVWAWPVAWQAFGGDVAAMLPASMMCVLPVAWALMRHAEWPGLLAAVVVIAGLAALLSVVTYPVLLLFVVLVAMFVHFTARRVSHV